MSSAESTQHPTSSGGIFPQTGWSMVLAARDGGSDSKALEDLCRIYWRPIYLYIRGWGHTPAESEDLTQEFFYRLLRKDLLQRIEGPEKGRMRSFLCVLLKRFLADEHDKRMTQKRGGDWRAIPIDSAAAEARFSQERSDKESPDLIFDRNWARDLLDQALKTMRTDYRSAGKEELFERLLPTISPQLESLPYATLAKELDLTEGALKVAVHRFRQRYRDCLHTSLRETLDDPNDTEKELRYLLSLFTKTS